MARSTLIPPSRLEQALEQAAAYVTSRQCRNGGFCYYRYADLEEPNLHDTYYAVAAYERLQREIPSPERVVAYLRSMQTAGRQSSYLYYYGFTAHRLGDLSLLDPTFVGKVAALSIPLPSTGNSLLLSEWLEDSLRISRLQQTFTGGLEGEAIVDVVRGLLRQGGAGTTPNLRDTYVALRILAELDNLTGLEPTQAFIERLQVPALGFHYTEGAVSAPDIDTLYAGVFSCVLLGLGVRYAGDILSTVLSCQRRHGGFARTSDSLGNLNTHYKAVRMLYHWRAHQES
ncbi:MAG TPA: hypothetical protein VES89_05150 [Candidatus Competibacteraceae bacterium]|nr:hypothetical protein [Candidatus Competibacteraceae bacterium]